MRIRSHIHVTSIIYINQSLRTQDRLIHGDQVFSRLTVEREATGNAVDCDADIELLNGGKVRLPNRTHTTDDQEYFKYKETLATCMLMIPQSILTYTVTYTSLSGYLRLQVYQHWHRRPLRFRFQCPAREI